MYFTCFNLNGLVEGCTKIEDSWSKFLQVLHILE